MSDRSKLLDRDLPKWPQMIVTGETVSIDQAREIIRRTDSFFTWGGGNNRDWNKHVKATLGMPLDSYEDKHADLEAYWKAREQFLQDWGFISLGYISNNWISCACAQGPQGWVHPDGHIDYHFNVGKWPSVEDIYSEWKVVAKAFPFLKLEITLMNGEYCEDDTIRVVSMLVRDGEVTLVDPDEHDVHAGAGRPVDKFPDNTEAEIMAIIMGGREREIGIPKHWIDMWAKEFNERKQAVS